MKSVLLCLLVVSGAGLTAVAQYIHGDTITYMESRIMITTHPVQYQ